MTQIITLDLTYCVLSTCFPADTTSLGSLYGVTLAPLLMNSKFEK